MQHDASSLGFKDSAVSPPRGPKLDDDERRADDTTGLEAFDGLSLGPASCSSQVLSRGSSLLAPCRDVCYV